MRVSRWKLEKRALEGNLEAIKEIARREQNVKMQQVDGSLKARTISATVHPDTLEFHQRAHETAVDCLIKKLEQR